MKKVPRFTLRLTEEDYKRVEELKSIYSATYSFVVRQAISDLYNKVKKENKNE